MQWEYRIVSLREGAQAARAGRAQKLETAALED